MPDPLQHIAKIFIAFGIIFTVLGALLLLFKNSGIPFLGKLPGDIVLQRKNFTFYFPVATSILLSIILSVIFFKK
jgi:membrane associated rhomboid family serine protease